MIGTDPLEGPELIKSEGDGMEELALHLLFKPAELVQLIGTFNDDNGHVPCILQGSKCFIAIISAILTITLYIGQWID